MMRFLCKGSSLLLTLLLVMMAMMDTGTTACGASESMMVTTMTTATTAETSYMLRGQKVTRRRTVFPPTPQLNNKNEKDPSSLAHDHEPSSIMRPSSPVEGEGRVDGGTEKSKIPSMMDLDFILPTSLQDYWNETIFEELSKGPYDVYRQLVTSSTGVDDDDESSTSPFLPILSVPFLGEIYEETATTPGYIFSAFAKDGQQPILIENSELLLSSSDIERIIDGSTSSQSSQDQHLQTFSKDSNFHSYLMIAKVVSQRPPQQRSKGEDKESTSFLGLVVSYHLRDGSKTHALVPFGKVEDFFLKHNRPVSEERENRYLLEETAAITMNIEVHQVFEEMMERLHTNTTYDDYYHYNDNQDLMWMMTDPNLQDDQGRAMMMMIDDETNRIRESRIQALLFQLLIRRTYLFSYGYANCLMASTAIGNNDDEDVYNSIGVLSKCVTEKLHNIIKVESCIRSATNTKFPIKNDSSDMVNTTATYHRNLVHAKVW